MNLVWIATAVIVVLTGAYLLWAWFAGSVGSALVNPIALAEEPAEEKPADPVFYCSYKNCRGHNNAQLAILERVLIDKKHLSDHEIKAYNTLRLSDFLWSARSEHRFMVEKIHLEHLPAIKKLGEALRVSDERMQKKRRAEETRARMRHFYQLTRSRIVCRRCRKCGDHIQ